MKFGLLSLARLSSGFWIQGLYPVHDIMHYSPSSSLGLYSRHANEFFSKYRPAWIAHCRCNSYFMVFGLGVSCCILYYIVSYLYVSCNRSIISVGEERANLSAIVYL